MATCVWRVGPAQMGSVKLRCWGQPGKSGQSCAAVMCNSHVLQQQQQPPPRTVNTPPRMPVKMAQAKATPSILSVVSRKRRGSGSMEAWAGGKGRLLCQPAISTSRRRPSHAALNQSALGSSLAQQLLT